MHLCQLPKFRLLAVYLVIFPMVASAQQVWEVMVEDNEFVPASLTITAGDTVRFLNFQNFGNDHDVVSEDGLWTPPAPAEAFSFAHKFTEPGTFNYYCSIHRDQGMVGVIEVLEGPDTGGLDFNPGHNGNWWNGLARNGEGVQLELADAGDGELVFVATIYSYGPDGGQIFLVAVGTPDGDTVEVDVFITEGGVWGDDFNPDNVLQPQWGTGVFMSTDCDLISMMLTPNTDQQSAGYTVLGYDLVRLTTPAISCPYDTGQ